MSTPDLDQYMTARQVSALAGLSEATLSRLRKQHRGPRFARVSEKRVVYNRDEVLRWLDGTGDSGSGLSAPQ